MTDGRGRRTDSNKVGWHAHVRVGMRMADGRWRRTEDAERRTENAERMADGRVSGGMPTSAWACRWRRTQNAERRTQNAEQNTEGDGIRISRERGIVGGCSRPGEGLLGVTMHFGWHRRTRIEFSRLFSAIRTVSSVLRPPSSAACHRPSANSRFFSRFVSEFTKPGLPVRR